MCCSECAGRLSMPRRSDALTCSPRCRQRRSRRERFAADLRAAELAADLAATASPGVPVELLEGARWVRWRSVERRGRRTKLPLMLDGRAASSTDPATWSTFADACASEVGDGLGVVLLEGDDVVCLDLDHVLDEAGRPTSAALWVLAMLPRTFVEVSPSGDGLHVFGRSRRLLAGRRVTFEGVSVEAYPHGRYMTVTGERFNDAPLALADLDAVLDLLLA